MNQPDTMPRPPAIPVPTRVPFAFVHINKCAGSSVEIALGIPKSHETAAEMRARLGPGDWRRRLTFTVIRDPFDRVVSIYHHRLRAGLSGLDTHPLALDDWIRAVWGDADPLYADGGALIAPCAEWICEPDTREVMVDEILRIENLDADWRRLAARLGVSSRLDLWNANPHPPAREVLSARSRTLIETVFADDLALFDYAW